jgi:hypothetical protein
MSLAAETTSSGLPVLLKHETILKEEPKVLLFQNNTQ